MKRRFHDSSIGELAGQADGLGATMIAPLIAIAVGAGIARGVFGIGSAQKQGIAERTQIKRAYEIAHRRMGESQAYTRQGTNESLNARGILNGGSNSARGPVLSGAYEQAGRATAATSAIKAAFQKGDVGAALKASGASGGTAGRGHDAEQASLAADAEAGQTGEAGTLSGQVNSDLSREFYGESQDLASQRDVALTGSQRGQSAGTAAAIGSGIDVGTSVYNAGSMIKGAFGAQKAAVPAPTVGEPNYQPTIKPGSWFGGYDPVDPLGMSKKKLNTDFNVAKKP